MKFAFSLLALAAADNDIVEDDVWQNATPGPRSGGAIAVVGDSDRRYDDLEAIAKKLWQKNGLTGKNKFDDRKYWAYGCHCFILGDRPMSEMGHGRPVDALDNKCKAYKDCQKCVRAKHGEQCIGEFKAYTWKWSKNQNGFVSSNAEGSCERELFECDVQFAKDTYDNRAAFNEDYHAFWSETGFDKEDDESCPSGGTMPVEHQCCGGVDAPWYWISTQSSQCCGGDAEGNNGVVKPINDQC